MKSWPTPPQWGAALLAAVVWTVIGLFQRRAAGEGFVPALLHELPLAAVVFVLAVLWVKFRHRR